MKQKTQHTDTLRRQAAGWLPLAACALMLAACTADDTWSGKDADGTPVAFTAGIQSVALPAAQPATPHTRTTIAPDGETMWTEGDAVGVFMLSAGGTSPADILSGAANIPYTVDPATGALKPAPTPIYYPQGKTVDFVAYYPYAAKGGGKLTEDYQYTISLADQSDPASIDILRATATGKEKSKTPVGLPFTHVLSKIVLDITLGDGLSALPAGKITEVTLAGMPASATLSLTEGSLTPGTAADMAARRESAPSAGATATFTALVPPQATPASPDRRILVTVNGSTYAAAIPTDHAYDPNSVYSYPITVQKTGIIVDKPTITVWDTQNHGTGSTLYVYTLTYDPNDPNGSTGSLPTDQATANTSVTLRDASTFTPPTGKTLAGWSATPDASADFYRPGDPFTLKRHTTLYAVWSGDGSSEANPILIYDEQGMKDIAGGLTKHYRLMKDIALNDWQPLGADGNPFTGTFHGGGHTLTINSIASNLDDYAGIFSEAGPCHIRQLCVTGGIWLNNSSVFACGGIVGRAADGCTIENCLVTATITAGPSDINLGGILGQGPFVGEAIIKNCLVLGSLNRSSDMGSVGGIVGDGDNSAIVNCVVLSPEITGKPNQNNNNEPYRIGLSDVRFYNYANRDMSPGAEWPGHQWTSKHDGNDGADCDAKPAEAWWMPPANWHINGDYTAWDFTDIWELGTDGYPRLRIIQ